MGVARDNLPRDGSTYSFMAGFAEVEVDVETGVYHVVEYLGVVDVGTVIHPNSLGAQIHGGGIQGMGHLRSQKMVIDPHYGASLAKRLYNNKPPTILDAPTKMSWAAVELPDPSNPIGAKGIGEPSVGCRRRVGPLRARRGGRLRAAAAHAGSTRNDHDVAGRGQTRLRAADGVHLGGTRQCHRFAT